MKRYFTFVKASSSDGLVSYPGHLLRGSYTSAEMQLAYSSAPADWAEVVQKMMSNFRIYLYCWINEFKQCFNQLKFNNWISINFSYQLTRLFIPLWLNSKGFDTKKSLNAVFTSPLEQSVFWDKKKSPDAWKNGCQ